MTALDVTLAYHERTKHRPFRFAPALGYMDWETQPDPFRRFEGAAVLPLDLVPVGSEPRYEPAFALGRIPCTPLDRVSISQLFQDALALSAWKQAGNSRWSLRVNPSSGNLHPTEGYLIAGPIAGLQPRPAVYHYTPFEHALELRAELPSEAWLKIAAQLPEGAVLVGLTSIWWRESWKYGERAFRYCHHDAGHAIGSFAVSAAGLGWEAALLESVTDGDLAVLLGAHLQTGVEAEHADCLLALFPQGAGFTIAERRVFALPGAVRDELRGARWSGVPNRLSSYHRLWPVIDEAAAATEKLSAPGETFWSPIVFNSSLEIGDSPLALRRIIHQRRSAIALDGHTAITRDAFYQILHKVMPGSRQVPFTTLPWRPSVDLLLFVHRVADVRAGLYALLRDPARKEAVEAAMDRDFVWTRPAGCPGSLPLFCLQEGDARPAAQQTSCDQEIAADGVFAAAMLADYRASLDAFGPWFYRRLHWETGVVGQVLYLEAEASGIRSTGIGCFFDDLTHEVFGLTGDRFQVLYHFAMGGPLDDPRLQSHPPYQHLASVGRG
ncbi:MAG: SagB/ThcOx family dehydrogenase [Deltaproteobacteria bacterium]|nr:MAG: SagB/ThcOx family dehydrogenase [Deltaproteobacteria bacterium]